MPKYIYDIECNGFLEDVTKLHCISMLDLDTGILESFGPDEITEAVRKLSYAELRVGHNIIKFDDQVIRKVTGVQLSPDLAVDTLVLSRLLFGDLSTHDVIQRYPSNLKKGSHSLAAWGIRLGLHKIDYTGGFDAWTPEMQAYCDHDVKVTEALYKYLMSKQPSSDAMSMEMSFATLVATVERGGMPFDVKGAAELYRTLAAKRDSMRDGLQRLFPPWTEVDKVLIPKRDNKTLGYTKGVPVTKYKEVEFNPGSRQHIAKCLTNKYGWKPSVFTPSGQAQIDETILGKLPYPEAQTLAEFFLLQKRIGMLAEGDNSWLKTERNGRIHANYNTLGTVTGRTSCRDPNLQQVPSTKSIYGHECRSLFYAPDGYVMLGADMSGLELRCLAHYMAHFDDGAYAAEVVNGDIHSLNQAAAGLPTRDNAKTFIYGFLYGAGDAKIGQIVGAGASRGRELKDAFLAKTPALKSLRDHVSTAAKRGFIKGLDGRHIPIRSEHAALNSLLQSAGAILCKRWALEIDSLLRDKGFTHNDVTLIALIHDEVQMLVKPEIADDVGRICVDSAVQAGEYYNFRCPITAEYRTGRSWAETH